MQIAFLKQNLSKLFIIAGLESFLSRGLPTVQNKVSRRCALSSWCSILIANLERWPSFYHANDCCSRLPYCGYWFARYYYMKSLFFRRIIWGQEESLLDGKWLMSKSFFPSYTGATYHPTSLVLLTSKITASIRLSPIKACDKLVGFLM